MTNNLTTRGRVSPVIAGYLAVLFAAASWGTSGIMVKFITDDTDVTALALAFWRDASTFLVLLIGVRLLRPSWLQVQQCDILWLAALGGSLGTFHAIWSLGIALNGVAVTTVQQAAMPAIVALMAWSVWREPLTWRKGLAITLAFVGTVLVSGLDVLGQTELSLPRLLIGMGIPCAYAAWNLFGKKMRQKYNPITVLTYTFGFSLLVLLPLQIFTSQPWPVLPITGLWFAVLVLLSTILPFFPTSLRSGAYRPALLAFWQ